MYQTNKSIESGADPQFDIDLASKYIELLTGQPDTPVTFQTFDQDSERKSPRLNRILHGSLTGHAQELIRLNQLGSGIFVMVNQGNLQGRSAKDVTGVRAVFADFDDPTKDPLDQIARSGFDPDYIVESSPGKFHAYRRVAGLPPDPVLFAGVQRLLAAHLGSDPVVHDLPRILRLPGSIHRKVKKGVAAAPFVTRFHEVRAEQRVTPLHNLLNEFGWTEEQVREAGSKGAAKSRVKAKGAAKVSSGLANFSGDPFSVQIRDGEGRNAHVTHLAGVCAARGLGLDASIAMVRVWNAQNVEAIEDAKIIEICSRIWTKESAKRAAGGVLVHTELGFAQMFAAAYADRFRYAADLGRWLFFDGRTWCSDFNGGQPLEAAKSLARSILDLAAKEIDDMKREALRKFNARMETAKALKNALSLAQSDPVFAMNACDFDRDPMLLAVDNGVVNLTTGGLRIARPEDLITKRAFVTYDAGVQCPRWLQFIEEVTCGDAELAGYLQRMAGYCCTGSTNEHALLLLVGEGSNGKSVFTKVLADLLGMYATRLPASALAVRRSDAIPNDIAMLAGTRMALASEMPSGMQLDEAKAKDLASDDTVTARFMHQNYFVFTPTHKLVLATNHLPIIQSSDGGIWRRLKVARFQATFDEKTRDPRLIEKLAAESSGVLNWLVQGCLEWQRRGLDTPQSIREWTGEYRQSLDVVGQFIDGACLLASDDPEHADAYRVSGAVLFDAYEQFARANGLPGMKGRSFGEAMKKRFKCEKRGGLMVYKGIAVIDTWVSGTLREKIGSQNLKQAGVMQPAVEPFAVG